MFREEVVGVRREEEEGIEGTSCVNQEGCMAGHDTAALPTLQLDAFWELEMSLLQKHPAK